VIPLGCKMLYRQAHHLEWEMLVRPPASVLFVCLGNICRSPLAEGVFRAVAEARGQGGDVLIDSAGTGGWHAGSAPDPRSISIAARYGIDIAGQKARKICAADFERFNLILGMDRSNVDDLRALAPASAQERVHLFLEFATGGRRRPDEVPDPYHGGADGFAEVYRMIRDASEALADRFGWSASAPVRDHASSTI
jgi:low molecular weight protein-tyrosine phosphatase